MTEYHVFFFSVDLALLPQAAGTLLNNLGAILGGYQNLFNSWEQS